MTMCVALNEIRNNNQKLKTLRQTYLTEQLRQIPDWDDDAQSSHSNSLKKLRKDIRLATGGAERTIEYLDKGIVAVAQLVLLGDGIKQPEPPVIPEGLSDEIAETLKEDFQKAKGEYWKQVTDIVDSVLSEVYTKMRDKPFGAIPLADGNSQKTVDGAMVEKMAEDNAKRPKGKKAGKVTKKKLEDDGSEAEAAGECETKPLLEEDLSTSSPESTTESTTDGGTSDNELPESSDEKSGESAPNASTTSMTEIAEEESVSTAETNSSTSTSTKSALEKQVADEEVKYEKSKSKKPKMGLIPKDNPLKAVQ